MYVSLAEVEFGLAEKLMKCIYEGEISVTNQEVITHLTGSNIDCNLTCVFVVENRTGEDCLRS